MDVQQRPCLRLPVPEIIETFQYSFKHTTNRQRPPKLQPLKPYNFNRSHSSAYSQVSTSAHVISFTDSNSVLSASYDRSSHETYFEQCFTRLAKIGEGSFGEVFKVQSKEDGLLYAVKMSKQLFRSEYYRLERLEEVRRYEQFSGHSNCVRFFCAWEQDDRLFMQMELCRENLESYLERKQRIPEEKIWSILLDLLLAVKSLHDRNLIHLDIKLDNVLIGDDGSCKLADFGLVVDVDKANRHETTEGDSRYIAPEIMQGKFSKAADIFSLGIAMLELSCSLELPANGPLWQQLRSGLLPEDFIKSLSSELLTIIKQMMAPDSNTRPTVNQLLSHRRFVSMLNRRHRWESLRKVKQHIQKSHRAAWLKLCNLKTFIFAFLTSLVTSLKLPSPDKVTYQEEMLQTKMQQHRKNVCMRTPPACKNIISSTPTSAGGVRTQAYTDFLYDNSFELSSQQTTPTNLSSEENILNSTPANWSQHSQSHHHNFRSRKDLSNDLSKTSFKKCEDKRNNFLEEIQTDENSLYLRRSPDLSTISKVLFPKLDDSE